MSATFKGDKRSVLKYGGRGKNGGRKIKPPGISPILRVREKREAGKEMFEKKKKN